MLSFRKNVIIKAKIEDYLGVVNQVLDQFKTGMEYYLEHHLDDHFNTSVKLIHGAESKADDLRREIESELFGKSLLPEAREDIIKLIDLMDEVPGMCEQILRSIYTHNIILPNEFNARVKELVELGVACCRPLKDAVMDVLGPCQTVKELARTIDTNESVADKLESEIIYDIFHNDFDPYDRIMYRDLILWIASLPDLAESICDQLTIFAIKRTI